MKTDQTQQCQLWIKWLPQKVKDSETCLSIFPFQLQSNVNTLLSKHGGVLLLTFHFHAHLQALLQPAELAAVSVMLVDNTVLAASAAVGQILSHAPFEETFATFTTDSPIVTA